MLAQSSRVRLRLEFQCRSFAKTRWQQLHQLEADVRCGESYAGRSAQSFAHWVEALSRLRSLQSGDSVHSEQIILDEYDAAVSSCAKHFKWEEVLQLLGDIQERNLAPTKVSFLAAIHACSWHWALPLALLDKMVMLDHSLDVEVHNAAIDVCRYGHEWQVALRLMHDAMDARLAPDILMVTNLSRACSSALQWEGALSLFAQIPRLRLSPHATSWGVACSASVQGQQWRKACIIVNDMHLQSLRPEGVLYYVIFLACASAHPKHRYWILQRFQSWVLSFLLDPWDTSSTEDPSWHFARDLDFLVGHNCLPHTLLTAYRRAAVGSVERRVFCIDNQARTEFGRQGLSHLRDPMLEQILSLGAFYTRHSLPNCERSAADSTWVQLAQDLVAAAMMPDPCEFAVAGRIPRRTSKKSVLVWLSFDLAIQNLNGTKDALADPGGLVRFRTASGAEPFAGGGHWTDALHVLDRLHGRSSEDDAANHMGHMCETQILTGGALAAAIVGCEMARCWKTLPHILKHGEQKGIDNARLHNLAMGACLRGQQWTMALHIFRCWPHDLQPDMAACALAVSACGAGQLWQQALALVDRMRDESYQPDTAAMNSLLRLCSRKKFWVLAAHLFEEMHQMGPEPNDVSYCLAVKSVGDCSKWTMGTRMLAMSMTELPASSVRIYNAAISACAKGKAWRQAVVIFSSMLRFTVCPDVGTFGATISAFIDNHEANGWKFSLMLLDQMFRRQVEPDVLVYTMAVLSCIHHHQVAEAARIARVATCAGVKFDTFFYKKVRISIGKSFPWHQAVSALEAMSRCVFDQPARTACQWPHVKGQPRKQRSQTA